jgi:uncharacterized protein
VTALGSATTELLAAAEAGAVDRVLGALEAGASADAFQPGTGLTALMIAAGRGHSTLVRVLLRAGADPNAVDRRAGAAALHKACQGGHFEAVQALVEGGAYLDHLTTTTGHSPLIEAIWFKSDAIVAYLLDRDARLTPLTYYGFTIDRHIEIAKLANAGPAARHALDRIEELVRARRDRDERRMDECRLIRAVVAHDVNAVRQALREGADLEARWPIVGGFEDGHTALLVAARDAYQAREANLAIVRELIAAGADVNAVEPIFGAVPLHKATYFGYDDITRVLAAAPNINLDYQGPSNGYTPLHDALWHAYPDCATVLVEAGARVDLVAYDGKLPVDIARQELGPEHPIVAVLKARARAAYPPRA